MDAKSGKTHWTHDSLTTIYASPLIVDDKVYLTTEDGNVQIFRLAAEPQEPLADIEMDGGAIYTAPIYANGVLYVATRSWLFAITAPPK